MHPHTPEDHRPHHSLLTSDLHVGQLGPSGVGSVPPYSSAPSPLTSLWTLSEFSQFFIESLEMPPKLQWQSASLEVALCVESSGNGSVIRSQHYY